jgi:hypothetical protein
MPTHNLSDAIEAALAAIATCCMASEGLGGESKETAAEVSIGRTTKNP